MIRGSNLGRSITFFFSRNRRNRVCSPPSLQLKRVPGVFHGSKSDDHYPPPCTVKVKHQYSYTSASPLCLLGMNSNNNQQIYIYDILPYQIQHNWLHCFNSYRHKKVNYTQFSNGYNILFTLYKTITTLQLHILPRSVTVNQSRVLK